MSDTAGASTDPRVGLTIAGRYRVESRLGEGGMGVVYLAEHVHMRKRFAVKVLHRELTHDPKVVARFEREAVAAARIEHPNVVAAKDFGRLEDGSFYLVLEYVRGQSLRELLTGGALSATRALGIARQIVDGLSAAHQAGIIHRDLKPDNVLLVEGGHDRIKVLDFGIAKLAMEESADGNALTQAGSVFGTPEYMAPEQALGQTIDHRVDIYALGVVLYEMLAGHAPFESSEAIAVLAQQMAAEPPPLPPQIDSQLASLVMTQLTKDPNGRAATAQALRAALDATLAHIEAVGAGGPPLASGPDARVATRRFASPDGSSPAHPKPEASIGSADTTLASPIAEEKPKRSLSSRLRTTALSGAAPLELGHVVAFLGRGVRIHTATVPLWVVLGLLISGAVLFTTLLFSAVAKSGKKTAASSSSSAEGEATDIFSRARHGDPLAIAELEKRGPEDDQDAETLLALGAGRIELGKTRPGLDTITKAVDKDKKLGSRPELLRAVRLAADDPDAWRDAIRLAARLGSSGADLLWDVKQRATPGSSIANETTELLSSSRVREAATPALLIAIDLSKAKGCPENKALLGRARESADERSLPYLEKLAKKTGCGRRARRDCFSCLRKGSDLEDAVEHARKTRAPNPSARSAQK